MATMQDLSTEVAAETSVNQSVVTLLNGVVDQLKAAQAANDPAAITAVITSLQSNQKILTDAITANTPVTPAAATATTGTVTVTG